MTSPLEYEYGGQWFDDMGSLALYFKDSPSTGIDLARSGVSRTQANDMATQMQKAGLSGYDEDLSPDLGA